MRQSDKQNTIKLTKPVSPQPITSIQQIKEDADLWPVIDGVKQKNGFAYCDGSTLDNTSGKYDNFNTANESLVLPNGPYRTSQLTESTVNVSNDKSMMLDFHRCIAYSDTNGNWRIKGNFKLSGTSTSSDRINIGIAGIQFLNTEDQTMNISLGSTGGTGITDSTLQVVRAQPNINNIFVEFPASTVIGSLLCAYDVALQSAPTWADTNLESYPVISLYDNIAAGALGLPEATATQAGVVTKNKWQRKNLGANVTADTTVVADLSFNHLEIGKTYKYYAQLRLFQDVSDGSVNLLVNHDGATISASFPNHPDGADTHPMMTIFTATATSITFQIGSVSSGTILQATNANRTYAILEELNNYETATTDFT